MLITSNEKIKYAEEIIEFELKREFRKSLTIRVLPTTKVRVKAPIFLSKKEILNQISNKAEWIIKQRRKFIENYKPRTIKKYENGELYWFLGKPYELNILESKKNSVTIENSSLIVQKSSAKPKNLVLNWYKKTALEVFQIELDKCFEKFEEFNFPKPDLKVRSYKRRWGCYNKKTHTITMNIDCVKTDLECIDYILFHELSHCIHFCHDKSFYNLLSSKCPNWKDLKKRIEKIQTSDR